MKSLSFQDLCLCMRHIRRMFFTQIFLTDDDGDEERWRRKPLWLLKKEFMLFPSSLLLFLVVQLIKCKRIFLELNPKGLCQHWLKSSTRREIRQFHVVMVLWRHRNVQKALFACIVVVLIMQIAFLTFLLPFPIWALSTLIHRSIRVHILPAFWCVSGYPDTTVR